MSNYRSPNSAPVAVEPDRASSASARAAYSNNDCEELAYNLLLACLRRALNPGQQKSNWCLPDSGVSWQRFLSLAERHQVIPLVFRALENAADQVPETVLSWLEQRYRTIVAHNLALAAELLDLLDVLRELAIPAIPFKGPALASALYGSLSLRQVADLDLFVERNRIADAFRVLAGRGYVLESRFTGMSGEHLRRNHKDIQLIHPVSGIHLDLHWSASEPTFDRELSELPIASGQSTVFLMQRQVPIHAPEDLLLLLSLHGLRHGWETLKWICDLTCLIRSTPNLNWSLALKKAKSISRVRMVLLGVQLARDLIDIALPVEILKEIDDRPAIAALSWQIYRRHLAERELPPSSSPLAVSDRTCFDALRLVTRDKLSDRIRLLFALVTDRIKPNAEDRRFVPLPTFAEHLYWFIRPCRLLLLYGFWCSFRSVRRLFEALNQPSSPPQDASINLVTHR